MVNRSKKMEVKDIIIPNIINGLDLMFASSVGLLFEEDESLNLFLYRLGKGLITIKLRSKLITLKF